MVKTTHFINSVGDEVKTFTRHGLRPIHRHLVVAVNFIAAARRRGGASRRRSSKLRQVGAESRRRVVVQRPRRWRSGHLQGYDHAQHAPVLIQSAAAATARMATNTVSLAISCGVARRASCAGIRRLEWFL